MVVRVRPLAETGGHSDEREAVYKRLASWASGTIVLEDNVGRANGSLTGKRTQSFEFANGVLGTGATQREVYDTITCSLVKAMCADGFSAFVFAYGQVRK